MNSLQNSIITSEGYDPKINWGSGRGGFVVSMEAIAANRAPHS